MVDIVIENMFDWAFDGSGKWDFYTNDNYSQYKYSNEFYISYGSSFGVSILGKGFTYKNAGVDFDGAPQYELTGGTVTGFLVSNASSHTYITGASISATKLSALMKDGTGTASAKIFGEILKGDDDVVLGLGNDRFETFGGDDVIRGRGGNDWIKADAGDDVLYGGTGRDTLIGGSGQDMFVFDTKANSSNWDIIDDFSVKDDTIVLDHLMFRGIGKAGDLASAAFYSNTTGKAHDASDRVIYNSKTGDIFYDADGSGAGAAVRFAHLDAGLKLTASDFDLI